MNDIKSPYSDNEYNTCVDLLPHQMNNDIYKHLKSNLQKNIENKCNKYGYVTKLYNIVKYDIGQTFPENFSASVLFKVTFNCRICIPIIGTELICNITNINKAIIAAENGPIIIIITTKNINLTNFNYDKNNNIIYNDTKDQLKVNDLIKIKILAKKSIKGSNNIKIIGFLNNLANTEEKEIYYNDMHHISKIKSNTNNKSNVDNNASTSTGASTDSDSDSEFI
jgi:DNA-directed RNA polymerase subunit E'/Rpb7